MRRSQMIRSMRREADEYTPDVLSRVTEEFEKTKQAETLSAEETAPVVAPEKKSTRRLSDGRRKLGVRLAAVFAAAAACLAIVLPIALHTAPAAIPAYATVCVKINPSVELTVEDGIVTDVRALNKDAAVLLVHSTLEGLPAETACVTVADLAESRNLMTEDGIALYVSGKDEEALEANIRAELTASNYKVADSDDAYAAELSERYGISYGKARLAAEVLRKYPQYAEEAVVKCSSEELLDILEDYDEGEMDEFEAHLMQEYQAQYQQFVQDVESLLLSYEDDLRALDEKYPSFSSSELLAEVEKFNLKYQKLGEDFLIEPSEDLFDRNEWKDIIKECIEEAEEVREDLEENADETFADLFEDWLEDFQNSFDDD